jgi:hypothetical protein
MVKSCIISWLGLGFGLSPNISFHSNTSPFNHVLVLLGRAQSYTHLVKPWYCHLCGVTNFWRQNCPGSDLSGALLTGLVQSVPDLFGIQQFCFQNLITSSLLVTTCPFFVSNLYFISLISGWILIRRSEPRTSKMWLGPPSGVAPTRRLWLVGLLLAFVTIPHTPTMKMKKSMSCTRSTLLLSAPTACLKSIPRGLRKEQSIGCVVSPCMSVFNRVPTQGFGLTSTRIGTPLSNAMQGHPWLRPWRTR